EKIGAVESAGARHGLDDHGRPARQMRAEMAREKLRMDGIAAARAEARNDGDCLAGELDARLGVRRRKVAGQHRPRYEEDEEAPSISRVDHCFSISRFDRAHVMSCPVPWRMRYMPTTPPTRK